MGFRFHIDMIHNDTSEQERIASFEFSDDRDYCIEWMLSQRNEYYTFKKVDE